jgi:hypothetical protein
MVKVSYVIKNKNGYIVEKAKKFELSQEAIAFVRELQRMTGESRIFGKPLVIEEKR